ncbi:MAG: hypothetical protein ACRYGO_02665 [Janthinobacterium lividum]
MSANQTAGPSDKRTPAEDLTPSGRNWVSEYRGSNRLQDLRQPFRGYAEAFIDALRTAGATVTINATYRPPKRAYLMHWSWKIARLRVSPEDVPAMDGVSISWKHYDRDEKYSESQSIDAAREMVRAFQMERLGVVPSLRSRHTVGSGIDMRICWNGNLTLPDADGNIVKITSLPRTGMNCELHRVGASYGVVKYNRSGRDDPHWSDTGA